LKYWYIKEQRNLQLQKENMESQLQLLKAQIHPHFLFNTLNNIYSYTQNTSSIASQLVLGLSDMLRYMLYEGEQTLVLLSRELKMIADYISIEKIRYGNRLELQIDLPEECNDLQIAPLLLLPFVENCFKHGTSNFLENPWLSLQIGLEDDIMTMKLVNGKSPDAPDRGARRGGIGIHNVRKRLELVYPWRHKLTVTDDPDVFIIDLRLQLEKRDPAIRQTAPTTLTLTHD
jgi:LytS/YehU family sensor histidine kinase